MTSILYGQRVTLQNGWNNWNGGFLDVCGYERKEIGNYLRVSTAKEPDRDNGSGTWIILSATGKPLGSPVMSGDAIHLQNAWDNDNGGFLDVRGWERKEIGDYLRVSTAKEPDRDNGSSTWIVELVDGDGPITPGKAVTLRNNWKNGKGGFLDTRGYQREFEPEIGNYLHVSTAKESNRDNGSGHWRFGLVPQP